MKRWAAGKEGNLRALLSTLQYVRALYNAQGLLAYAVSYSFSLKKCLGPNFEKRHTGFLFFLILLVVSSYHLFTS